MSKQSNNPTLIGLTQQLKPELWTWASDPQNATALDCDALSLGTYLVQRLEHFGCKIEAAYAIIHDKDEQDRWNEVTRQYDRVPKERHIHAVFRFKDRKSSASLEQLAGFLGVEPQYVEKPKAGRYAFDNMLAYLVHAKYRDKYQYQAEEVATLRGANYMDIYAERREVWARGAATIKTKNANEAADYLRDLILEGAVSKEQVMLTNELYVVYARHKQMMEEAFEIYGERRAYQAAAALRNGEFRTAVLYLWGRSGSGKTFLARSFVTATIGMAQTLLAERWRLYRAATGNPLDDWRGEEIIFLDDLRGSAMDANEWLLLLDPENASPARARYRNKHEVAPRLIVMTATVPPEDYFFYTPKKGDVDEALDQFIRRLTAQVMVTCDADCRSYTVSSVGRLDAPRWISLGQGSHRQVIEMSFGAIESVEHSFDGTIGSLMGSLDAASPLVGISSSDGWDATQQLVESERVRQVTLEAAKQAKALPAASAGLPAEEPAVEPAVNAVSVSPAQVQAGQEAEARREAERERCLEEERQRTEVIELRRAQLAKEGRLDEMAKVIAKSLRDGDYVIQSTTGRKILPVRIGAFVAILPAEEEVIVKTVESPWTI